MMLGIEVLTYYCDCQRSEMGILFFSSRFEVKTAIIEPMLMCTRSISSPIIISAYPSRSSSSSAAAP